MSSSGNESPAAVQSPTAGALTAAETAALKELFRGSTAAVPKKGGDGVKRLPKKEFAALLKAHAKKMTALHKASWPLSDFVLRPPSSAAARWA